MTATIRLTITSDDESHDYTHTTGDMSAALRRLSQFVEQVSINHAGGVVTIRPEHDTEPWKRPRPKPKTNTHHTEPHTYTDADGREWVQITTRDKTNPDEPPVTMWRPTTPDDAAPADTLLTYDDMKAIYG